MRIMSPSGSTTRRSGCVRSTTRRASPSCAPANANAAAVLPTPAGPWKRKACASPSPSAAVKQPLCLVLLRNRRRKGSMRSPRPMASPRPCSAGCRVPSSTRYRSGNRAASSPVGRRRRGCGSRRPPARSGRARRPCGAAASSDADLEQDRPIGHQPLDGGEVELEHALEPEPARDSLVGDRRVDVAVADHGRSSRERGPDHLLDVLGARGCVERGLGPRARRRLRGARGRGSPLRAACRPARASSTTSTPSASRRAREQCAPGSSCRSRRALESDEHRR